MNLREKNIQHNKHIITTSENPNNKHRENTGKSTETYRESTGKAKDTHWGNI
jgi:hypothetical protein